MCARARLGDLGEVAVRMKLAELTMVAALLEVAY
jgi:hypothetical protein